MIKLRPVRMNCNWEDEVDEYQPEAPFQKEWDEEYGYKSPYKDYHNYIIPYSKVPRSFKLFLENADWSLRSLLIADYFYRAKYRDFPATVREALQKINEDETALHYHGGSIVVTFKLDNQYANQIKDTDELEKVAKAAFDYLPKYWESEEVHMFMYRRVIDEFRTTMNSTVHEPDEKEAVFMNLISGTEIPRRDLMEFWEDEDNSASAKEDYLAGFLRDLNTEDLVEKLIRMRKITKDVYDRYH